MEKFKINNKVDRFLILLLLFTIVMIVGCADSHKVLRATSEKIALDRNLSIYISLPKDGNYNNKNYSGSGATTAHLISHAFSSYSKKIETGSEYQSQNNAINYARQRNHGYVIFPVILAWVDRATEWSGLPDKASVRLTIIDIRTGHNIDSVIIKGKSGLATFGGDHPQDLLEKPLKNYVQGIF